MPPGRCTGTHRRLSRTHLENAPPLDAERRDLLLLVACYAGQALERLRLLQDTMEARLRAELLHGLARAVITAERVDPIYEAALEAIALGLGATRASVLSFDEEGVMRFRAWRGLSEEYRSAVEGHSPWTPDEKDAEPLFIPDVEQDPGLSEFLPLFRREGIGSLAFVPLVAGGRLLGKFMVYYEIPRTLTDSELATACAIADHVAAAMNRFDSLAELQRTLRFNEMFAGILGHDLRNPLSAIMTAAQILLLKNVGDERALRPVSRIVSSGERMSRLIDQLLDFSRIRLGSGLPLERREVDIVRLLRQLTEELELTNPEALIRLQHDGDAQGWWDEDRLGQLFSNLVGNAVQHGAVDRPVIVRVESGRDVVVHIHNEGSVPADILPRLFEPMPSGERRWGDSQGLGLGLYIAHQIATAHAGTIQVDSSDVRGTTFTVTLPRGRGRGGTRVEP